MNGHLDIVKYLVERGANIRVDDDSSLRYASYNGHLDVVKYLVESGADVHVNGDEPLRIATDNGHTEVVNYLKSKMKKKTSLNY